MDSKILQQFEQLIKRELQALETRFEKKFATKDDLKRFATKDDLKHFATKDDLKRFATKDDLKHFATKGDLKRFATKDDLVQLEKHLEEAIKNKIEESEQIIVSSIQEKVVYKEEFDEIEERIDKIEKNLEL